MLNRYLSDQIEKYEMGGASSTIRGRGDAHTGFWWGNLRERDNLEDPGADNIKMDFRELGWGAWNGLIELRIWTGDRSL